MTPAQRLSDAITSYVCDSVDDLLRSGYTIEIALASLRGTLTRMIDVAEGTAMVIQMIPVGPVNSHAQEGA